MGETMNGTEPPGENAAFSIRLKYLVTGESAVAQEVIAAFRLRARWMDRVRARFGEVSCTAKWSPELNGHVVTVTSHAPQRPGVSTERSALLMVRSALMNESRSGGGATITLVDEYCGITLPQAA